MELADFRQDAVATTGLAMPERHNGCYIADVVGRGKTCIGAEIRRRAVARHFNQRSSDFGGRFLRVG